MERDAIISHGAAEFLKERLMDQSDAYTLHVCRDCKVPAIHDFHSKESFCNVCKQSSSVSTVRLPYACKLLFQELMSQGIVPKIAVE